MECTKPVRIFIKHKSGRPDIRYPDGLEVPCGKCLACRIQKRKEWSLRMLHELDYHNHNSFVTLTYNAENLPHNGSLVKRDFQLFMKRLRKHHSEKYSNKLKYFACGEYGDLTQRPHYHAILFGSGLIPEHKQAIEDNWPYGFVTIGMAEPDSINYVAQYIDKKLSGDLAYQEYNIKGREPVFRVCSHGLGLNYALENRDQIVKNGYITKRGIKHSVPRYYCKKLDYKINPDVVNTKDCEVVEGHTGIYVNSDVLYKYGNKDDVRSLIINTKKSKIQHNENLTARMSLKNKKL